MRQLKPFMVEFSGTPEAGKKHCNSIVGENARR